MTKVRVLNCDTEGRSRIMHQLGCNTNTFSWDANICLHLGLLMTRGVTKRNLFLCGDGEVQRAELSVPIKQRVCLFCLRNLATRENKTQHNKMLPQELMNATSSQTTWQLRDAWRDLLFIVTKIFIEMFATAAAVSPRATCDVSVKVSTRTRKVDQIFCYFTRICCDLPSPTLLLIPKPAQS